MAATSINDLDLSKVEDSDVEKLGSSIESFYSQDSSQKAQLSYNWEKNHLMLDGSQWLVYDNNRNGIGGVWSKLTPSPANEYIPRPVTNYLFDAYQTLKGYILKNKPRSTVRPNTQSQRDKSAAKLAELILECNYEKLKEAYNLEHAASCLILYGTVFKKDYWDNSYLEVAKVPRMEQRPATDPNTGQPTGAMEEVQAVDPMTGDLMFDEIPIGDVNTAIIEPYRIAMDPYCVNIHEARWIMEYSIRPLDWIMENYDRQEEGYTGLAKEVKEESSLPNSLRRFFQLRTSSGVRGNFNAGIGPTTRGTGDTMIENAAVVKEYYERPTKGHSHGRLIVVANKKVLYVGESPYIGPESGDWHPYSECRWEMVPGRFWGKSPFDDATEIQKQINSIDSVIVLTRKTMAVPQKLIPHTAGIQPGVWTGQPGQEIFYRSSPDGEPHTVPGQGVDSTVFKEREQRLEDLKNITGAIDILKGDRPPGVTAASALNMLFEVGTGKLFPILDRWKMFIENSQKKQLRLIANKYKEPRQSFIAMLKSRNEELSADQIDRFIGMDLWDNCNVVIEASSAIPKLKAAEQSQLMELGGMGILNLQDPYNLTEFLSRFGVQGFNQKFTKDQKRASWENDLMDNIIHSPDNKPVVLNCDDDAIHIQMHEDRQKEPSFMALPTEVQTMYMQHIEEHNNSMQMKQQQQTMQQMMMGVAPQPQENSQAPKGQATKQGHSPPKEVKSALQADIIGPGAGLGK